MRSLLRIRIDHGEPEPEEEMQNAIRLFPSRLLFNRRRELMDKWATWANLACRFLPRLAMPKT
jgi:hypothetical protein